MFKLLCVTNRALCREDFLFRLEKLAAAAPDGILLREKDLSEAEYKILAKRAGTICADHGVPCILHSFVKTARELNARAIHLPLPLLRTLSAEDKARFTTIGVSCHSVEEAIEAERLGGTYLTAGHIFATDCKKGLPGRGLEFLREVCGSVSVPVYAIGGIAPDNIAAVRKAGAAGACVMSQTMVCDHPADVLLALRKEAECEL